MNSYSQHSVELHTTLNNITVGLGE